MDYVAEVGLQRWCCSMVLRGACVGWLKIVLSVELIWSGGGCFCNKEVRAVAFLGDVRLLVALDGCGGLLG